MKENNTNQAPNERANWVRFAVFLLLIFAAKSSLANWNYVPSGSMQPNLLIGPELDKLCLHRTVSLTKQYRSLMSEDNFITDPMVCALARNRQ